MKSPCTDCICNDSGQCSCTKLDMYEAYQQGRQDIVNEFFNFDKVIEIEKEKGYNQALDDFRKLANEHLYDDNLGDFAITDSSIDEIIGQLKK